MAHSLFKPKRRDKSTGRVRESRYWSGQYRLDDDAEYTRLSLRTTDKRVAQRRLEEIITRAERVRAGILPPPERAQAAATSLADHLAAFVAYQRGRHRSPGYIRKIDERVRRLITECGWAKLCDITPASFVKWRQRQTLSPKTLNEYQAAIHVLLEWLRRDGLIERNPLDSVGRVDGRGHRTFERRALTDDEASRLVAISERRRPVYLLALHTGLRLSELRTLTWHDVDLDAGLLTLRAAMTKSRRADVLPLSPSAWAVLVELDKLATNRDGRVLAGGLPSHTTFHADLEAASIPKFDHRGRKVDFHALRTTFISNLQRAGVPQRHAMALARHTDARLTAHVYTDTDALPLAAAIATLPTHGIGVELDATAHTGAHKNAHGDAQTEVFVCRSVSQRDSTPPKGEVSEVTEKKDFRVSTGAKS